MNKRFPRYHAGELVGTLSGDKLLSKLEKLLTKNILQDMQNKRSFHIHDWNRLNREFITSLKALPPPPPPP